MARSIERYAISTGEARRRGAKRERVYEVGNDRPMVSPETVVEGITAAGRAFIEEHGN